MYYCRRCRLYFEDGQSVCPLCGNPLQNFEHEVKPVFNTGRLPHAEEQESFWIERKKVDFKALKKRLLNMLFVGAILSTLVLLGSDLATFLTTGNFAFSNYRIIVTIVFAAILFIILANVKAVPFVLLGVGCALSGYLILLDIANFKLSWSIHIGLPIIWAIVMPIWLPLLMWRYVRIRGLNIIGFFMLALAASLLLIDFSLPLAVGRIFSNLGIFAASLPVAIALFLFYLHYILRLHLNFDHIFKLKRTNNEREIL
ncbi:MAG: hypothetical protein FWE37_04090 [Spirochaetaceae bacterium]|nr:hypothetical protein [Spirochaetaceae bacterium]